MDNYKNSKGISTVAIVIALAVVLIVVGVIVFTLVYTGRDSALDAEKEQGEQDVKPVYEATIGEIKFTFNSAIDHGNVLEGSLAKSGFAAPDDLVTTERFIEVTVSAQNKGLFDTKKNSWKLGNIIDSEGRNFVPAGFKVSSWLPRPDTCGDVLKPEFKPTSCVQIYEVSTASKGLKIEVYKEKQKEVLDIKL